MPVRKLSCWFDRPEFGSRQEQGSFIFSKTSLVSAQLHIQRYRGSILGVKLTIHLQLVLRLIMDRASDVLLTVPLSITLANDQLDEQFLYFIMRLLQSSTCFEHHCPHHQEVKLY